MKLYLDSRVSIHAISDTGFLFQIKGRIYKFWYPIKYTTFEVKRKYLWFADKNWTLTIKRMNSDNTTSRSERQISFNQFANEFGFQIVED